MKSASLTAMWTAVAYAAAVTISTGAHATDSPPRTCDRSCLTGIGTTVLKDLVAHSKADLPLAATARYTENGVPLDIGRGLWRTATGLGTYRHDYADPATGQLAVFTVIEESQLKSVLMLRVRVAGRKISEIETLVGRFEGGLMAGGGAALDERGMPEAIWHNAVPAEKQMTRQQLIDTANQYFDGLQHSDGKGRYPFAADCNRIENGIQTTNNPNLTPAVNGINIPALGCKAQFESGFFRFISTIRDRRFLLLDREQSAVFGIVYFDHDGDLKDIPLTNGQSAPSLFTRPLTYYVAEGFRIEAGEIRRVEAGLVEVPYGMKSPWPSAGGAPAAASNHP